MNRGDFWSRVDSSAGPDACWPWAMSCRPDGYGQTFHEGAVRLAHRVAYMLVKGDIPERHLVMHSCDNRPCCNPAHLSTGTHADNTADMMAKGRDRHGTVRVCGENHPNHKLTTEAVIAMRRRFTGARGEINALALEYGVSHQRVSKVVRGKIWRSAA